MLRKIINIEIESRRASQVCAHKPLERVLASGVANANIVVIKRLVVLPKKILKIKNITATVAAVKPADNIFWIFISLSIE